MVVRCYGLDTDLGYRYIQDLGDITLGHGQQLYEVLSRSNKAMRSYDKDTDLGYVCTVTLTLEIGFAPQFRTKLARVRI